MASGPLARRARRPMACRAPPLLALLLTLGARAVPAQTAEGCMGPRPTAGSFVPATLQTWADAAWLRITDRSGSAGGRVSRLGILQRFQPRMDAQYDLNLLTTRSPVEDDADWNARASGARVYAGSFDRGQMAMFAEVKVAAPLACRWSLTVHAQHDDALDGRHEVARVRIAGRAARGVHLFVESSLEANKADMDGTVGASARLGRADLSVDVTVLDYANNVVNHNERLLRDIMYDSAYRYARQPAALRARLRWPMRRAWLELHATDVGPGRVRVDPLSDSGGGVVQGERASYDGALVGYRLDEHSQVAAFATRLRARVDRSPLPPSEAPADDYVLVEATRQVGAMAIARPFSRMHQSAWVAWTWRTETRAFRRSADGDVNYADRAVDVRLVTRYGADRGAQLLADAGIDERWATRGLGEVPGRQPVPHAGFARLALMLGWRGAGPTEILLGARLEHDLVRLPGSAGPAVTLAGFQGRGTVYW